MSEEKKSWDSIPSLDGLQVDWDFQPGSPHGRRSARRLTDKEVSRTFDLPYIPVKIATTRAISKGILQDISENGLAVRMQDTLQQDEPVKLGFFLGRQKIICKGTVRHVCQDLLGYSTCGIQLLDLDAEARTCIQQLYSSITLKQEMQAPSAPAMG